MKNKRGLAAFDFDGTITYVDSFAFFLLYAVGPLRLIWALLHLTPTLLGRIFGRVSRAVGKERVLVYFFAGMPEQELRDLGESFAQSWLPKLVKSNALDRLRWHMGEGHECVLVSASPEFYLIPWAKKHGFKEILATRLELEADLFTGRLAGFNCRAAEKVRRLSVRYGDLDHYMLFAYGDSAGDREMLAAADYAYYRRMPRPGEY